MWKQYKQTFLGMQLVIAMVTTFAALKLYRQWEPTALFFLVMEAGGIAGAFWATQIRKRFQRHV